MSRKISIGTFDLGEGDIRAIKSAIEGGWISTGKEMEEFEKQFSQYHSYAYGVMVNSGQSALEAALELTKTKLKKRKLKVVVPSTTYAATLWAVLRTQNEPIFCDIGEDYNINLSSLDSNILKTADVVLPVNLCGKYAKIDHNFMESHFIIRDACESVGLRSSDCADLSCYSFYVSHLITTGSGGMVCTNEEKDDEYLRSFISHGRRYGGDFTKYEGQWIDRFLFDKVGCSYRSDNIAASLGLSQFKRIDKIVSKRKENAKYLIQQYNDNGILQENFIFPSMKYADECVFQFFPILIGGNTDREKLLTFLYKQNIDSRVLLSLTNQPIFKSLFGDIEEQYPMSLNCNKNGFIIGCHQNLDEKDMRYVIDVLQNFAER